MRFTRLRLNGFKSFVDPTDLVIASGLTGVVGPNGCGKSNLLEALRWVMGESRPSAVRGDGMEDVIFAGAATRPARNFAEVALIVDNAERLAPSGFNDADHLEIIRRITRDAGSAYKVNGRDVRARDVQMLFADASTGAHSPALVRQGQISELINARPKNRRRVLEEAAGISGLYQRRHEAELRLGAAETNLTRLDDVIDQLAAQLAQLARQARHAARYREIGVDLRRAEGLLLYRRWQDGERARQEAATLLAEAARHANLAEAQARTAGEARAAAEAALPPKRQEDTIASAVLQRLQVQRDTLAEQARRAQDALATLRNRITQLEADSAREQVLNRDADDTIARLEAESQALTQAGDGYEARLSDAASVASDAASALQEREAALAHLTEEAARLAARHHAAQRLLDDNRKTEARAASEADRARGAGDEARAALARATQDLAAAEAAQTDATTTSEAADTALRDADEARNAAQSAEAEARAARSTAEGAANALRAELAGLARLVERDGADGGQVLDLVQVAPGYEAAFGAALADDLRAPLAGAGDATGWAALAAYAPPQPLPAGATPLAGHVQVPDVLARRMTQVGLVTREQGAALQENLLPGQRLVSLDGDLWRWDGLRSRAEDAPSAAALRLQQLNRLRELEQAIAVANAQAKAAADTHEQARAALQHANDADQAARTARRDADRALSDAARALSRAEADRNIAQGKLESLTMAAARHDEEAMAARTRLRGAEASASALGDLGAARALVEDLRMGVEGARITMLARRTAHDELRREGESRARRLRELGRELAGWRERHAAAGQRMAELAARKTAAAAELAEAAAAPDAIAAARAGLDAEIDQAEARSAQARADLAAAETAARDAVTVERDAERGASDAREARARADARLDGARETLAQAAGRIADELQISPAELLADLGGEDAQLPEMAAIEADVTRLRRQRDALGAVNLRAEEDAREVQEEHDQLTREKTDLTEAIKKLRHGIANLNREGRERLLAAFDQVNTNFAMLFTHLFGGGEARLVMVESDDPLEAGLEIMCQPPGKKLSTLSLLSGGEQTLTALALIFAVFLANPAPICVLDEVDAPLDDANVTRFCDMLDEMTRQTDTRFLIITHHAVTMARMDRLFGVTMQEQGVSQLVSVDLKKAEAMVA
ncbi:MAG: chromosome segregation protein SMC [Paracoccaceae bacterium]